MARLCRTRTDPTESKHHPLQSGMMISLRIPEATGTIDSSPKRETASACGEAAVRFAKNWVAFSFSKYELTMRNCSPTKRTTSPIIKYWFRLISIIVPSVEYRCSYEHHLPEQLCPFERACPEVKFYGQRFLAVASRFIETVRWPALPYCLFFRMEQTFSSQGHVFLAPPLHLETTALKLPCAILNFSKIHSVATGCPSLTLPQGGRANFLFFSGK